MKTPVKKPIKKRDIMRSNKPPVNNAWQRILILLVMVWTLTMAPAAIYWRIPDYSDNPNSITHTIDAFYQTYFTYFDLIGGRVPALQIIDMICIFLLPGFGYLLAMIRKTHPMKENRRRS